MTMEGICLHLLLNNSDWPIKQLKKHALYLFTFFSDMMPYISSVGQIETTKGVLFYCVQ